MTLIAILKTRLCPEHLTSSSEYLDRPPHGRDRDVESILCINEGVRSF